MDNFKEFAARAIAEYRSWEGYAAMLTMGFETLNEQVIADFLEAGQKLDRNITLEEIEDALGKNSVDSLKRGVETCRRRQDLYHEWLKIIHDKDKERRQAYETDGRAGGAG